jgi:hypothetical protein
MFVTGGAALAVGLGIAAYFLLLSARLLARRSASCDSAPSGRRIR